MWRTWTAIGATAMPDRRWKDRLAELGWRVASGPGATAIYITAAMLIAALASATTGIPAYVLVAVAVVLVLLSDPPQKIRKFRQQQRRRHNGLRSRSASHKPAMGPRAKAR
ncbi:hypothetical protein CO661_32100 [Sinorhizobium fredii]|uniref:Transmembrane protein n=1 Tax=Rhizobium fredii TaxID=380 RepID=A0A2A6LNY7_RHIFR|nr:hypothetical protein CO661_32100 [Sinorhizobium fredii]